MSYEPGDVAEGFELKNANESIGGKMVSLDSVLTKSGAVVLFECNHCPYVVASVDRINRAAEKANQLGMGFVSINSNDPEKYKDDDFSNMKKRAEKGMSYAYLHDDTQEIAHKWGAERTPEFYLLDGQGKVVYRGRLDNSPRDPTMATTSELVDAMDSLSMGEDPVVTRTQSIGCSIKWK